MYGQDQANHWKIHVTIPKYIGTAPTGEEGANRNALIRTEDDTKQATTKANVAVASTGLEDAVSTESENATPTLIIPDPEPPYPSGSSDEAWATGNATALTTYLSKINHFLLPALLTKWHKENAGLLKQPEFKDLLKAWKILVQRVDNAAKDYYNFIIQLFPHHKPFKSIHWKPGS